MTIGKNCRKRQANIAGRVHKGIFISLAATRRGALIEEEITFLKQNIYMEIQITLIS
jgi:hypothetical protein